jgi:hypothetical protein
LKKLLDKSLQKIQEAFTKIYWFQDNFRDVYNKYKHTLSEFTGVFGLDRATMSLQTEVYVRHKERDRICTYMMPVSPDDVRYLREIAVRVYYMLKALIENALLHIVNEGRDFVPKTLFIDEGDKTEFEELSGKIQSCIAPDFRSKVIVRPPEAENVDRINRDLKEKHLHKMDRDILDPSSLLKEGVKVTK